MHAGFHVVLEWTQTLVKTYWICYISTFRIQELPRHQSMGLELNFIQRHVVGVRRHVKLNVVEWIWGYYSLQFTFACIGGLHELFSGNNSFRCLQANTQWWDESRSNICTFWHPRVLSYLVKGVFSTALDIPLARYKLNSTGQTWNESRYTLLVRFTLFLCLTSLLHLSNPLESNWQYPAT